MLRGIKAFLCLVVLTQSAFAQSEIEILLGIEKQLNVIKNHSEGIKPEVVVISS